MKTSSAKAKGRRLQKLVHDLLHQAFPHLHDNDIRPVPMGSSGEDIQLSEAARVSIPVSLECKNVEKTERVIARRMLTLLKYECGNVRTLLKVRHAGLMNHLIAFKEAR